MSECCLLSVMFLSVMFLSVFGTLFSFLSLRNKVKIKLPNFKKPSFSLPDFPLEGEWQWAPVKYTPICILIFCIYLQSNKSMIVMNKNLIQVSKCENKNDKKISFIPNLMKCS